MVGRGGFKEWEKKTLGDIKTKCYVSILVGFQQTNCNKSGSFEHGLAITDFKDTILNF